MRCIDWAAACVRRKWIVLLAWLAVFAVLAVWARSAGPDVNDNLTLPGSDSQAATELLEQRFPSQANGTNPVVLRAPGGAKITDATYKEPIDATVKALKADPDVRDATSPLSDSGSALLGKDKSIGYIALRLKPGPSDLSTDDAERIVALADPARKRRPRGRLRRLPRPEGLQARDAPERGHRPRAWP